jgi:alpha-L-rhamnosidase
VGDHVLDPVVTRYDMRARYVEHDVTALLQHGRNTIAVILGNGWYNCLTREVWHFDKALWQDEPKMLLELESDGKVIVRSDTSWKVFRDGAWRFDQLRNGEVYDAGREPSGWMRNGFDDAAWKQAAIVPGPGGVITLQDAPPCKVTKVTATQLIHRLSEQEAVYDAGVNMTGWTRLTVKGAAGRQLGEADLFGTSERQRHRPGQHSDICP